MAIDDILKLNEQVSTHWDIGYMSNSLEPPADALKFGLELIDWDKNYSRLTNMNIQDLRIPFQFIEQMPTWQKAANYSEISDIMGRFESVAIYESSGPIEVQLILNYYALTEVGTWSLDNILTYINRLKALTYPTYDGNFSAPPKCKLNLGESWRKVPVIIKNVSSEELGPYYYKNGRGQQYKVTVDMRTSYPMWQAQSGNTVFVAEEDNRVFGYMKLSEKDI